MNNKPKRTKAQIELERISVERERQLNVEKARESTRAFSDNIAFRKKLRGVFSLLSGGFGGFPKLGSGGGRDGGGGGGGSMRGGINIPGPSGPSGGGTRASTGTGPANNGGPVRGPGGGVK